MRGLWRGMAASMQRSAMLQPVGLVIYDQFKFIMRERGIKEGVGIQVPLCIPPPQPFTMRCLSESRAFGPNGKSQNALKMGRFGTKNGPKIGQKHIFAKGSWTIWDAQTSVFSPL